MKLKPIITIMMLASVCTDAVANQLDNLEIRAFGVEQTTEPAQRYIIRFKQSAAMTSYSATGDMMFNMNAARQSLKNQGIEIKREMPFIQAVSATINVQQKKALLNDANIDYVEIDQPRHLMGESTPWGITTVKAQLVSDGNADNKMVCIIDSGYDIYHPDLDGNNHSGTNDSGTGNWYEPGGSHGTHVAGTIAAVGNTVGVRGVLPNQKIGLHIIKTFNDDGWGYSSTLISAIQTCADNGADVVNMSLGGSRPNDTEKEQLQTVYDSGVLLVAAAGNSGDETYSYPASYDAVVSVGAVDEARQYAKFSQYNDQVEIAAPGVAILSTVARGEGFQGYISTDSDTFGDDRVVPHRLYVMDSETKEFKYQRIAGKVTGELASCSVDDAGNYTCGDMTGKICIVRRTLNRDDTTNPDRNPAFACEGKGAAGIIVYSKQSEPALQAYTLTDVMERMQVPSVSVNYATGAALLENIGQNVTLESRTGTDYEYYNGTSMATPHVTGAAALVWSTAPECSVNDVRQALTNSADDLHTNGRDDYTGHGLVNIKAAADYLANLDCAGGTPDNNELENAVAKTNLTADKGEALYFTMEIPANSRELSFVTSGGSGDVDLYVKFGSQPDSADYDCRPYKNGNNESCNFEAPQAGTYYLMLKAYSDFSDVKLIGNYTEDDNSKGGTLEKANLSASRGSWKIYTIDMPADMSSLSVTISGGSGDADLYVKQGSEPTTTSYDCRPYKNGNAESCNFTFPNQTKWYIGVRAYSAYSNLNLKAEWKP